MPLLLIRGKKPGLRLSCPRLVQEDVLVGVLDHHRLIALGIEPTAQQLMVRTRKSVCFSKVHLAIGLGEYRSYFMPFLDASREAFELDRSPHVAAWAKNDHLGFEVTYSFRGIIRRFRPDYMVRLVSGTMLILEVKGQDNQEQQTKREFLSEWVRAVNAHGGFGTWAADVSRYPSDIHEILIKNDAEVANPHEARTG